MVDPNDKRENFKRVAEKRTEAIIEKIRNLSKTSNASHYSYDANQVNKMFSAISSELSIAKSKFINSKGDKFRF